MSKAAIHTIDALKDHMYNGASEPPKFIIYSSNITNRLIYTCRFVFQQGLICNFIVTNNEAEFVSSGLIRINYSEKQFENAFFIPPSGLLSETGIREFVPAVKNENNKVKFFPDPNGDCDFDIFSSVFLLISRYSEWQKFVKDKHGRFEIRNCILFKLSATKIPVIETWLHDIKNKLLLKYPGLTFKERSFKFISTIDVDNVYAFKAKPLYRNIGGALKDLLRGELKMLAARLATVLFGKQDPFDAYDQQIKLSEQYHVPLIYFFLYSNKSQFDRTIDPGHPLFKQLLQKLNSKNVCYGLHPSYNTPDNTSLLQEELKLMNKNGGRDVVCSRQHYLRFNAKTTPAELQLAGIKFDFTMGFASGVGFRAGTSLPFYYYDFTHEKELDVMAVPFCAMDGAYYIYDKISLSTAKDDLIGLAQQLQKVNGLFITVFHDRSFSKQLYPGWEELYTELHKTLGN